MKISQNAADFLARHAKNYEIPVLLIFYTKAMGWWGIERRTHIKHVENPFKSEKQLQFAKVEYNHYKLDDCPCPVYLDIEMQTLVENAIIDLDKRGMYRFLSLT